MRSSRLGAQGLHLEFSQSTNRASIKLATLKPVFPLRIVQKPSRISLQSNVIVLQNGELGDGRTHARGNTKQNEVGLPGKELPLGCGSMLFGAKFNNSLIGVDTSRLNCRRSNLATFFFKKNSRNS